MPDPLPDGYPELAPDLVVEILSPGDRPGEVLAKADEWLEAGCRLVWVLDRLHTEDRVHRPDGSLTLLVAMTSSTAKTCSRVSAAGSVISWSSGGSTKH